jgi:hypothetical protein
MDDVRAGLGFDVHPREASRALWLGGVRFDDEAGLAGLTQFTEDPAGPHRIARTVHATAFFTELFTVLA